MPHKSRLACIVIDCKTDDIGPAGAFWSRALGATYRPSTEDPRYGELDDVPSDVKVLVQAVDHDSRVHLDIETDDREAEAKRLEALGARRIADIKGWIVMEAPTGQRFCIVKPQSADFDRLARTWS